MIPAGSADSLGLAGVDVVRARALGASRSTAIAERFADLLLLRSPAASEAAAARLVAQGVSAREVYLDVLAPALVEIGARWQRGICSVAQEHLATAVVGSIMTNLAAQLGTAPPVGRRIVLACTDGERHDTGLRMVRDFLVGDGWEVFYVGAETPSDSLQLLVYRVQPDVVGLSTTLRNGISLAEAAITALRAGPHRPFVLLGGAAYGGDAARAGRIGGDAFAANAGEASRMLRDEFAIADDRIAISYPR